MGKPARRWKNLPKALFYIPLTLLLFMLPTGTARAPLEMPLFPTLPELRQSIPLIGADAVHALGITGEGVGILIIDDMAIDTPEELTQGIAHGEFVAEVAHWVAPGADLWQCHVGIPGIARSVDLSKARRCLEELERRLSIDLSHIRVVNMSFGSVDQHFSSACPATSDFDQIVQQLAARAIFIAASGNDYQVNGISWPACLPQVISVGAVYDDYGESWCNPDRSVGFSGDEWLDEAWPDKATCYSNGGASLDLLAPGSFITLISRPDLTWEGTSFAAPHVAGTTALMLEANPALRLEEVRSILIQTGKQVVNDYRQDAGYHPAEFPRVDAFTAVLTARGARAEIALQGARLMPAEIKVGESLSVYITLENRGSAGGSTSVTIRANGETMIEATEWIEAASRTTFTYTLGFSEPGTYEIAVEAAGEAHLIGVVTVEPSGPQFILHDAWLEPTEAEVGDRVTVYLDVENLGGLGNLPIEIWDNGSLILEDQPPFTPGERKRLNYKLRMERMGEHRLTLLWGEDKKLIGIVQIIQSANPPLFVLEDALISPGRVEVGETVIIRLGIRNAGGSGTLPVRLYANGRLIAEAKITLAAGETKEHAHTWAPTQLGTYTFSARLGEGGPLELGQVEVLPQAASPIEEAIDQNGNNLIDDPEILIAVQYWISGQPVPNTGGQVIDDAKILQLVGIWVEGSSIGTTGHIFPLAIARSPVRPGSAKK